MAGIQQALFGSYGALVGDFESIASASGTGSSGVITFSSIPSTYMHLQIRSIGRCTAATDGILLQFNADTGANYSWHRLMGDGASPSAASSVSSSSIELPPNAYSGLGANIYGVVVLDILDYANTNKYKTTRVMGGYDNNGSGYLMFNSGNWRSTSAITSLTLSTNSGSWEANSRFALYGIK